LEQGFRGRSRLALAFSGANALNLYARDAPSVHFHDREAGIAILKTFSSFGNET
jgi:hypothetical protein